MSRNNDDYTEENSSAGINEYTIEELDIEDLAYPVEEFSEAAVPGTETAVTPEKNTAGAAAKDTAEKGEERKAQTRTEQSHQGKSRSSARDRSSRKKKKSPWGKILGITVGVLILGAACAYGYGIRYYSERFLPGTFIDGVLVENLTPEEAEAKITQKSAVTDSLFTVTGKDGKAETVDLSSADLSRSYSGLDLVIETQNKIAFLPEKNIYKYPAGSYSVVIGDPAAFEQALLSMEMADPEKTILPKDAGVVFDEASETYMVIPEQEGTAIVPEPFVRNIRTALEGGAHSITFPREDPEGIYQKPKIYSDDASLCGFAEKMNALKNIHAKVDLGAGTLIEIPTAEIRKMLVKGLITPEGSMPAGKVTAAIDKDAFDKYLFRLDGKYTTKSKVGIRYFVSATGKKELVNTDYGWEMNKEATGIQLYTMLDEAVRKIIVDPGTVEQCPEHQISAVWTQEAASHETANDIGNTWAEVDLANQTLYLVVDGEKILESPVVTGMYVVEPRRTPTGFYNIFFMTTNRDLVGLRADGTESYRSHVNYWMPFNKNIGLHDATWRGSFGGNIYMNSGSHGCVNMPLKSAEVVYRHAYVGMPVIVYEGTKNE